VKPTPREHYLPRLVSAVLCLVVYLQCFLCSAHHLHYSPTTYCRHSYAILPAASHNLSTFDSRRAIVRDRSSTTPLAGSTLEGLAKHEKLYLIVDGQHTGTSNTTENIGTSTLEERSDTLSSEDLASCIHGALVFDSLTGSHHHTTTDSVQRVRSNTSTSGDSPTEEERGEEVALKGTNKEDGLQGVVHAEVQTTVDDYAKNGGHETTVETGNTIGSEGLLVDVHQAVELTVATLLGVLSIVGKTGTGVVERVDEEERSGTGSLFTC